LFPIRSSTRILPFLLAWVVFGVITGCNDQSGSIDIKKAPPVGLEDETRPLKPNPSKGR
jgi:hypothetical protein